MFDAHLNRQVRLSYFARGPGWAFAVPEGDLDALEEVMRACSEFWNGAGSLLVPVSRDGRVWPNLERSWRSRRSTSVGCTLRFRNGLGPPLHLVFPERACSGRTSIARSDPRSI